jgi:hypothetical protein
MLSPTPTQTPPPGPSRAVRTLAIVLGGFTSLVVLGVMAVVEPPGVRPFLVPFGIFAILATAIQFANARRS